MKHKILLLLFAVLLVTLNSEAQDFWEELPFPDINIGCVAINTQGEIFVGTLDANSDSNGVYRSSDIGQSWKKILSLGTFGVISLEINDGGTIYAGTNAIDAVFKSSDNGETWSALPNLAPLNVMCINTQGNDTVWISQFADQGALLLQTTNNGETWDTVFATYNHVSESVRDIEIAPDDGIYIGLVGYFAGQGGIYKSADQGATWQYVGLQDYQVKNIEINQAGDIFIGARDMGTYAIYHDKPDEIKFLNGSSSEGMVINSAGYIYVNSDWPSGTLCSYNNGESFSWVSTGSLNGPSGLLVKDQQDYLYSIYSSSLPYIYRTKEPTYTGLINHITFQADMSLYPNPVTNQLTGKLMLQSNCEGRYRLSIVSMSGQVVMEEEIPVVSGIFIIPVTSLPAGVYVVNLSNNTEIYQARFVKL